MKVLVCGGRNFSNTGLLETILSDIAITELIHGTASGADTLAENYALAKKIPVRRFPAEWDRYGRGAGPKRNALMLSEGKPDLVVAFPGGAGTANMIRLARSAGVRVREILP